MELWKVQVPVGMDTSLLLYPTQDKVFVQSSSYLPASPTKGREGDGNTGDFIQGPKLSGCLVPDPK
jgi:hypothetical protein